MYLEPAFGSRGASGKQFLHQRPAESGSTNLPGRDGLNEPRKKHRHFAGDGKAEFQARSAGESIP